DGAIGSRCRKWSGLRGAEPRDEPMVARGRRVAPDRRRARGAPVAADRPRSIDDPRREPGQRALRHARGADRLFDARADVHEHRGDLRDAHGAGPRGADLASGSVTMANVPGASEDLSGPRWWR